MPLKDPIKRAEYNRQYNIKNKDKLREYRKQYKIKNLDRIRINNREINKRRIIFKGKRLRLKNTPRKGICSKCGRSIAKGELKRTNLHHTKYDPNNPLNHTIELCPRCHRIEHLGGKLSMTKKAIDTRRYREEKTKNVV